MIPLKDDNPTSTFPVVTVFIIAVNVLVFFFQHSLGPQGLESFVYATAAVPYEITHSVDVYPGGLAPPLTVISSMFVHGGLFHLAGNMLFLWIFGDNIEDRLGHFKFVLFYLFTGALATLVHILVNPDSTVPVIGASGAVAGVLGAYLLLYPRAHVLTLIFVFLFVQIVRIPAVLFIGFWFLLQIASSIGGGGGIAWFAHIGGFIAGALIILISVKTGKKRLKTWFK